MINFWAGIMPISDQTALDFEFLDHTECSSDSFKRCEDREEKQKDRSNDSARDNGSYFD